MVEEPPEIGTRNLMHGDSLFELSSIFYDNCDIGCDWGNSVDAPLGLYKGFDKNFRFADHLLRVTALPADRTSSRRFLCYCCMTLQIEFYIFISAT